MRYTGKSIILAATAFTLSGMLILPFSYFSPSPVSAAGFSTEVEQALETSTYAYIASERKSGELGTAAEIWYMSHDGAVWVGTPKATYRAKRILAGRTKAHVALGKKDGPAFDATGSIVTDPKLNEVLFEALAKKYPSGWKSYESGFREGFKDGSRVLIKYESVE